VRIASDTTGRPAPKGARAFTLIEILTSVLIIAAVLGLVTVGLRIAGKTARGTVDRQTVTSIKFGLSQFQQDFGFAPPLVKDQAQTPERVDDVGGVKRIAVYIPSIPADRDALTTPTRVPTAANPFLDNRYSEQSLAYYLAGALDIRRGAVTGPMIDGVSGPGLYKPDMEGYFEIPKDVLNNSSTSKRVGTPFESFVSLSGKALSVRDAGRTVAPIDPAGEAMVLADREGVAIRYYRWRGDVPPIMVARKPDEPSRTPSVIPTPPDRDLDTNPAARGATWAIVAAGPNGVFGDEPIEFIAEKTGASIGSPERDIQARYDAEEDNIVEFGQ